MKFTDLNGKTVSEIKNRKGEVIFSYERKIEREIGEPMHFHDGIFKDLVSEGIQLDDWWEFYNCDFIFCDFYWASVYGAKFFNCKISNCNFRGANFYDTVFDGSVITECDFGIDSLGGSTSFNNCDFEKATVMNCNFEALEYDEKTKWPKGLYIEEFKKVKKQVSCP